MDYIQLKNLLQQNIEGTILNVPLTSLESGNIITIAKQFIAGEALKLEEISVQYKDQDQNVIIQGDIKSSIFSDQPLSIIVNLFFINNNLEATFKFLNFSNQWNLESFLPELHGTFLGKVKLPNPQLLLDSQLLNKIQMNLSSENSHIIPVPPLNLEISNMAAKLEVTNPVDSVRQISADIKGEYILTGMQGGEVSWKGTILFDTISNGTESGFAFGMHFPQSWVPVAVNSVLEPILDKFGVSIDFEDSGLLISNLENVSTPPHLQLAPSIPIQLQKGTTFFSTISLKGKLFRVFKPIFGDLGAFTLAANLNADIRNNPITVKLLQDPKTKGNLQFSGFRVVISPENKTIKLAGDVSLIIENNRLDLDFISGLSTTGDPSLLLSLKDDTSKWENPFGIPGITISDIVLGIKFTGPIFVLTLGGEIVVGGNSPSDQIVFSAALELKNGEVPTALFANLQTSPATKEGVTLDRLVKAFTSVNLDWIPLIKKISLKHMLLCIATNPTGFEWDGKTYYGLVVDADINFFGLETKTVLEFNYKTGVRASAELGSPIEIQDVLRISDASGTKGPIIMIDTTEANGTPEQKKYFYLSAAVSLFSLHQEIEIVVIENGFSFNLKYSLGTIADFILSCTLEGKEKLTATATLQFTISDIKIQWEKISLNLNVSVTADLDVKVTPNEFVLGMDARFSIFGNSFTISFSLNKRLSDLKELPTLLISDIKDKGWDYLKSQLSDPGEFLKMCKEGIVEYAGELGELLKDSFKDISVENAAKAFQHAGYEVDQAIDQLQKSFGPAREQMTALLKNANFTVIEIASGLSNKLGFTDEDILKQLKEIHFPSLDIGKAMQSVFDWDSNKLTDRMNLSGFSVQDVASVAQELFQLNNNEIATVLKNAGYSITEINDAFQEVFHLDKNSIVGALHVGGFSAEELTDLCQDVFDIKNAVDVGDMLERAGVTQVHIENVIKVKFPDAVTKWTPQTSVNKAVDYVKSKIKIKKPF
ncbi:hypothetical protein [Bacillus cereus group sp. MYBK14-1]|uniref:hypothetical protein n=1 Tax=Bacillus cereus group sp. MYBK14-1 TaxID=3450682 RepID=UPI003F7AF64A